MLDETGETHRDAIRDRWASLVGATVVVLTNRLTVRVNCRRVVSRCHRRILRTLYATAHMLLVTSRERAARAVGEEESFASSGSLRRPGDVVHRPVRSG